MNIYKISTSLITRRTISAFSLLVCSSLASFSAMAVNQNTVLAELETAPSNWNQPTIQSWINDFDQGNNQSVSLGDTVTISVNATTSAHFVLALVDSYGEVKIIRPSGPTNDANFQFTAEAPVGQYSLFAFASENEIPGRQLGIPDGQNLYAMDYKMEAVENFITGLNTVSSTNPVAKASEYQFIIEDGSLALQTRGLMKTVSRMQDGPKAPVKKKKPVIIVKKAPTTPVEPIVVVEEPKAIFAEPETVKTAIVKVKAKKPIAVAKTELPKIKVVTAARPDSLSLDIKFQLNSASLTQKGINALDSLGSALLAIQRSGKLPTVMLEGHTDDSGEATYNLNLSEDRANSARTYLLERFGLPDDSIQAAGFGESTPKTPNVDNAARQINRRVELKVVK